MSRSFAQAQAEMRAEAARPIPQIEGPLDLSVDPTEEQILELEEQGRR